MSDVEITYKLVPTEESIRSTAARVTQSINKSLKGFMTSGEESDAQAAKLMATRNKELVKIFKDLAAAGSPVVKTLNALKNRFPEAYAASQGGGSGTGGGGGAKKGRFTGVEKVVDDLARFLGKRRTIGTKMEAGQSLGVGGGGGVMEMVKLLGVIAVAMIFIQAFFEAVGPFIKVVMKLFAAFFLIALLPALKILMKSLPLIWGVLKVVAQGIASVLQAVIDIIGSAIGDIASGNVDWTQVLLFIFAPVPMIMAKFIGPMIISLGKQLLDWLATALPSFIDSAISVIKGMIDFIGSAVFGKDIWNTIKECINQLVTYIFNKNGVWSTIMGAITWISDFIFNKDKGVWPQIQTTLGWLVSNIFSMNLWQPLIDSLNVVVSALQKAASAVGQISSGGNYLGKIASAITGFSPIGAIYNMVTKGGPFGDFIARPGGGIQSFSPDDTIIGVKNPGKLNGGSTIINNTYNINGNVDKAQLKQMMSDMAREQGRQLRTKTSYVSGFYS